VRVGDVAAADETRLERHGPWLLHEALGSLLRALP
jgi:hypothetical protein